MFEHPFVGRIADSWGPERGDQGRPVLEDETLAWCRTNGDASRLFVTGALTAGTADPPAGTVLGTRRAADWTCDSIETDTRSPVVAN